MDYLDSRMIYTDQVKAIKKGSLKKPEANIIEASLWFEDQDEKNRLFVYDGSVEKTVKVMFVDLPRVYYYHDPLSTDFFKSLADTDQLCIFERRSI